MEAKLTEICDIQYGYAFDSSCFSETEGTPLIRIRDVVRGFSETRTTESFPPEYLVQNGDILIGMDGEFNIARWCGGTAALNQRVCRLIPKEVDADYIFHFMPSALKAIEDKTPFVTVKHLSAKELNKIAVPLPSSDEQIRIGIILNRVILIIANRKHELQLLDYLIKARFVEMFGDQTQFPMQPLAQNVEEMFIGPFGSALKNEFFVNEANAYCMVYEQKHAIQKTMDVPTRFVDKTKYDELKRFTVRGGDIIVSCRGTIGEIFSVPEDAPIGIMHPSIMKIRLKKERYRNLFFVMMLEQYMRDSINRANGSGVKMAVTATELGKEGFVVPPIEKQIEYELIVKQIDKSKFVVEQSLDKAQLLFDSLMQKYFG